MGIDKDIHQNKFRNGSAQLINLLFTYGGRSATQTIISDHGITHQQFNILRILRGNHPTRYQHSRYESEIIV
jgi:hypothetical protein